MNFKEPEGQVARWLETLAEYDFKIEHRSGKQHLNADALSRREESSPTSEDTAQLATLTSRSGQISTATSKDTAQHATLAGRPALIATSEDTARSATHACSQLPHATGEDNAQPATFAGSSVTMATIGDTARSATPACSSLQIAADQAQMDEMRRAYPADADLTVVVDRLSSGRHGSIPGDTAAVRSLMAKERSLKLENGLLYRKFVPANPGSQVTWQLIVPRQQRPLLFQEAHAGTTSGHFAYKWTLEKLRQFAYWPGMSRDVEEWRRSCDTCAKRRSPVPRSQNRAPMGHIAAAYPFEKIAIDLMGPLAETPTGNKHLLVVCDYFSKWVELLALPDIRAETVAERLVEDVFSRFGMPECLHSDQGKQFESSLFQELCRLLGIHKTRTTPYHPQSDGSVERANRTVQNVQAAYVSDHQRDWDCYLAQTQLAYNTSQHSSTGYAPYFLLFGREARLPLSILVDPPAPHAPESLLQHAVNLRERQLEAYDRVREQLGASHRRQKEFYDRSTAATPLCIGDQVWLHTPAVKKGRTAKFSRP